MFSREPSRESEDSSNSLEPNRLLADFVGGLGPGQVAGRQALGAGSLGELQISIQVIITLASYNLFYTFIKERQRTLIVTVLQAKSLKAPRNTKSLPSP